MSRLTLLAALARKRGRMDTARALASALGAEDLVAFVPDSEVGGHLPGLGFPQTLPDGRKWRAFVARCREEAPAHVEGLLKYPVISSPERPAWGMLYPGDVVLVLLGGRPRPEGMAEVAEAMPLLGSTLLAERGALVGEGHAAVARAASRQLEALTATLTHAQNSLQAALMEQRRMTSALEQEAQRKDEFLATLAHELRNPLSAVRSAAQVLRERSTTDAGPHALDVLDVLDRQSANLAHLVDDLLDLSRISRGVVKLREEAVDLGALVGHAVEAGRPLFDSRGHALAVHLPAEAVILTADAVRVEQILTNLLTNAAKYTPAGGTITVRVERAGEEAMVRVADTGVGITADMLPRVFDLFAQAGQSLDRPQGGLGIGLTVSRTLAEGHGGTLTAQSPGLGEGSVFTLRLPARPIGEPAPPPLTTTPPVRQEALRRDILVVDDNRDSAEMVGALLEGWGHRVRLAFDGPSALEATEDSLPEVVVADIGLPGLDGYELAQEIRRRFGASAPRLVALSGYGQDRDRERSAAAGFHHHLTKPVDIPALRAVLDASRAEPPLL